jgi:hypothetical protein
MFPWKEFLIGQKRKIQKHKEERDRSGKFKKTRRKEWRKEKEKNFTYMEVPLLYSPMVGDALGLLL